MSKNKKERLIIKLNEKYKGKINGIDLSFSTFEFIRSRKELIIERQKKVLLQGIFCISLMIIIALSFSIMQVISNYNPGIVKPVCLGLLLVSAFFNLRNYIELVFKEKTYNIAMCTQHIKDDNDGYAVEFSFMTTNRIEFDEYLYSIFILLASDILGFKRLDDISKFISDNRENLDNYIANLNIFDIYTTKKGVVDKRED